MPTATGRSGPAERELAAINVNLIPDRPGQLLRQNLQERLGERFAALPARYDLPWASRWAARASASCTDTIATRVRLTANATWTLSSADAEPAAHHQRRGTRLGCVQCARSAVFRLGHGQRGTCNGCWPPTSRIRSRCNSRHTFAAATPWRRAERAIGPQLSRWDGGPGGMAAMKLAPARLSCIPAQSRRRAASCCCTATMSA